MARLQEVRTLMRIYHNVPALFAYNALNNTNRSLQKSIQTLSTGLRINSAADDAAGLAISEKMRAQISGMNMAIRNAEDGVSMLQTAEGALASTHSILQRMRELAVQAANDTLTQQDREYIQLEVDQLKDEINRISTATQFNNKKLLDGTSAGIWSSTDLATKAYIRGSLREIDQFGQKSAFEGNYKISITATPGQAEAKKTDIFRIKHPNVVMGVSLNDQAGIAGLRVDNLPAGSYTVKTAAAAADSAATLTGQYGFKLGKSYTATTETKELDDKTANIAWAGDKKLTIKVGGTQIGDEITFTNESLEDALTKIKAELAKSTLDGVTLSAEMDTSGGGTKGKIVIKAFKVGGQADDVKIELSGGATAGTPTATAPFNSTAANGVERNVTFADILDAKVKDADLENNASILYEVVSVDAQSKSVTLKATANVLRPDGSVVNRVNDNIVLTEKAFVDLSKSLGLGKEGTVTPPNGTDGALQMSLKEGMTRFFSVGNKFVYNVTKKAAANAQTVEISGKQTETWPYKWGGSVSDATLKFGLNAEKVKEKELHFRNFYLNDKNGTVYEGDIVLTTNKTAMTAGKTLATFEAAYIGQVAKSDVKLRDLEKFWTTQGVFMLTDPQTITISQGDGKSTTITLHATDTLGELRSKLNNAIANGLGQARFAVSNANDFVTFVGKDTDKDYGLETVPGTFIIRSLVAGAAGRLSFSGNEDLINALSLNVVQEAKENSFTASVYDAHTGATIASNVKVSGNQLIGVIHKNVDVEFDPMANIKVTWNENLRNFVLSADGTPYETVLHIVDNSTIFQVGANEGEDLAIDIGNMGANALGVTRVIVTDRGSATRAITILDTAIGKVSTQRAKIGAYQNSLEHTVSNLTTTSTNLTAAESRIRDADMAKAMMEFVKLQVLNQSGTSMLAQANQLPQNVLSLLRS